jgi:hypothetical protein
MQRRTSAPRPAPLRCCTWPNSDGGGRPDAQLCSQTCAGLWDCSWGACSHKKDWSRTTERPLPFGGHWNCNFRGRPGLPYSAPAGARGLHYWKWAQ